MLRRDRTRVTNRETLEFMVTSFTCKDESMLSMLGKHDKEQSWKVQCGLEMPPMEIKVEVDQSSGAGRQKVKISNDGKQIFPDSGKKQLSEDYVKEWPFRAQARGIGEKFYFQIRPEYTSVEEWYDATLTEQGPDGTFKATVLMPDGFGNVREEEFPAVRVHDIREKQSMRPMKLPESILRLTVPVDKPLEPILQIGESDFVTHYFARPTPPPKSPKKLEGVFKVDKDRKKLTSDIGHGAMREMKDLLPKAKSSDGNKTKKSWEITLGPEIVHKVEVEKKWKSGSIVTVTVDGETMVECAAEDIDTPAGELFQCAFRFIGEKNWKFEVFETNRDGYPLSTTGDVSFREKYGVDCLLKLDQPDGSGRLGASLFIDGKHFTELEPFVEMNKEPGLEMTPTSFHHTYGMQVPYKVNYDAKTGLDQVMSGGMFSMCCNPKVDTGAELVEPK